MKGQQKRKERARIFADLVSIPMNCFLQYFTEIFWYIQSL